MNNKLTDNLLQLMEVAAEDHQSRLMHASKFFHQYLFKHHRSICNVFCGNVVLTHMVLISSAVCFSLYIKLILNCLYLIFKSFQF